jgi:16S rRNA pseudouridine516 synthase
VVHEGKHHQVKRVFLARGNRVLALRRVGFGPLVLGDLQPGDVRALSLDEERALYASVSL